jgi:hypothetical protein
MHIKLQFQKNQAPGERGIVMRGTKRSRLSPLFYAFCCILAALVFAPPARAHSIERISVASDGAPANWGSWCSSLSADGRFVAFYSVADNLILGDINGPYGDIYVHDRATGITERVSLPAQDASTVAPSISVVVPRTRFRPRSRARCAKREVRSM